MKSMKSYEWCAFFQTLEKFPDSKVLITPEQEVEAAVHLGGCDSCYLRTERMEAMAEGREYKANDAVRFRMKAGEN